MFHFLCTKKSDFLNPQGTYSLRGVAMLMIILSHAHNGYPVSGDVYFPSWLNLLHMEFWGGMGVAVFLFLSGYGMTLSLSKREGETVRDRKIASPARTIPDILACRDNRTADFQSCRFFVASP